MGRGRGLLRGQFWLTRTPQGSLADQEEPEWAGKHRQAVVGGWAFSAQQTGPRAFALHERLGTKVPGQV